MNKEDWQNKGVGHRERLRDKFLNNGLAGFSEVEVIEILLSFGTPRVDCKETAKALLKKFNSFSKIIEAKPEELQKVHGVGAKNGFAISFVHAVAKYYLQQRLIGKEYITCSQDVVDYLRYSLRGLKREVLSVVFLDASHAISGTSIVAEGTLTFNTVYPREIIKKALEFHAAALILAHNHPSGSLKPSQQDIALTRNLCLLCISMQIQLLDHLIIGDGVFSFAEQGLIEEARNRSNDLLRTL